MRMKHPSALLSTFVAVSVVLASASNETNLLDTGSDRQGRGFLETVQGFIQAAQTVNKLFGGSNSNSVPSGALAQVQGQESRPQEWPKEPPGSTSFYNQYYNPGHSQSSNYPVPSQTQAGASSLQGPSQGDGYHQIGQSLQAQPDAGGHYQHQQSHSNLYNEYYTGALGQASDQKQVYYPGSVSSLPNTQQGTQQQHQHPYVFGGGAGEQGSGVNKQGVDAQPTSLSSLLGSLGGLSGLAGGGGLGGLGGAGGAAAAGALPGGSSDILSTINSLGIFEDLSELISFQNVEKVLKNVNKFDSLKCIPRLVCQTIARRQYEAAQKEKQEEEYRRTSTTTTTTTTTPRPKKSKKGSSGRSDRSRSARLIPGFKIQGVDTALEQVVKFLDLMQLKDWSIYPYVEGAHQGHQVKHWDECAYKFNSCPFSDEQLLYYFNNYKGGLFQSFRSDLKP